MNYLPLLREHKNILDWNRARRIRNETKLWVKNAKAEYIKHQLEVNAKDSKKFWRNIQTISPNQKRQTSIITLIDQSTKQYIPEDEVPDYINEYFSTVGSKLDTHRDAWIYPGRDLPQLDTHRDAWIYPGRGLPQLDTHRDAWIYPGRDLPQLDTHLDAWIYPGRDSPPQLQPTTVEEVAKLIKEIDITKSSSIDHISSRVLRDAFEIISEKPTYLFNLSISVSSFPKRGS